MSRQRKSQVGRRGFIKGAAVGAAALVTSSTDAVAQGGATPATTAVRPSAVVPSATTLAAETGTPPMISSRIIEKPQSDFMVDVLKALNLEYMPTNPGSSFQSLHESIINYGDNTMPELLTCLHEESAVAMAHGYAKIEGKPMAALVHGTVGLQHASMAIYNAYADRVPVYILVGNHMDAGARRPGVEWYHSAQDLALMVRDYVKWDDEPASLKHFADSAMRAYKIATTPPMGPVLIVVDQEMQEHALTQKLRIPKLSMTLPPSGDIGAVRELAKMLVAAQRPLIVCGRAARTPAAIPMLVELAELLQAPVNNGADRVNFPSRHALAGTGGAGYQADLVLGLEVQDMSALAAAAAARGAKTVSISALDLFIKSNLQDFQPYAEVDMTIAADAEATLPALIEEVKRLMTPDRTRTFEARGAMLATAHAQVRAAAREAAAAGWDASPISTGRLCAEVWAQIKNEDWSLVSWQNFISNWPGRLWNIEKHYHYIGGQGAAGIGYGAPAAVGAALANRKHGRLSVNIQTDGDLNFAPGVLWTAAHHKIPLLNIMHNNRAYHQEVMFVQNMASLHNRGADRAHIGTKIHEPNIDYAMMAKAYGLYAEGPISNPKELRPAITRGIDRVKRGEPVMLDVITQPR